MSDAYKRVLLTGGAGFIGSHVAEALLRRGVELTIVDRLDQFYSPAWKKANLEEVGRIGPFEFSGADICDPDSLGEVFVRRKPEAVIHLAARAGVRPSIEQPLLYERINVGGTTNLLELSRQFGVRKFLLGSSSSVYGATSRAPFSEDQSDLRPISPYAATKLAAELLGYTFARLFGFAVICLRFFTVYGPRQRPDLAIHKFVGLIEKGKPIPVYGDGSAGRDYTYVDDIVAGVLAALEYDPKAAEGAPFDVFNLGNSQPVKLADLIGFIERATGKKALRNPLPPQAGDVPLTWADVSKSQQLLGYHPAISIEEGLRRFVEWYRSADPARRA